MWVRKAGGSGRAGHGGNRRGGGGGADNGGGRWWWRRGDLRCRELGIGDYLGPVRVVADHGDAAAHLRDRDEIIARSGEARRDQAWRGRPRLASIGSLRLHDEIVAYASRSTT